jgi:hypothetical protein
LFEKQEILGRALLCFHLVFTEHDAWWKDIVVAAIRDAVDDAIPEV